MKWSAEGIMRGTVKVVFLLCYIAFMYASIQHVATFFANFEENSTTGFSSYLLATAFDLTALVVTTALMFFRKSMPGYIQCIVWGFVAFITLFSWYMNWVYAHHFQNLELISSVSYSKVVINGKEYFTAIPAANDVLAHIDPIIASSFTALNIVFTVVSEFFGTKPPTVEELQAKLDYKNSIAGVKKQLQEFDEEKADVVGETFETAKKLKEKFGELRGKPKDSTQENLTKLMDFYRDTLILLTDEHYANTTNSTIKKMLKLHDVNEAITWKTKAAAALQKEVNDTSKQEVKTETTTPLIEEVLQVQTEESVEERAEPKTEELSPITEENAALKPYDAELGNRQSKIEQTLSTSGSTLSILEENAALKPHVEELANRYPKIEQILSTSGSTLSIVDAAALSGYGLRALTNRVKNGEIKTTPRSDQKLFKKDFLQWLKTAQVPRQTEKKIHALHMVNPRQTDGLNEEQTEEQTEDQTNEKMTETEVETNPELVAIG